MVHLDVGVLGEIKRRQVIEENDKEKEKQAKKTRGTGSESTVSSTKVVKTLQKIDEQVGHIIETLGGSEASEVQQNNGTTENKDDETLVNGPQMPDEAISQSDIDKILPEFD